MQTLNSQKVALVFGSFAAIVHAIWSAIVGLGFGQSYLDFVFGMHFIINPYLVADFDLATAVGLIILAFVVAYIVGYVLATIWNHFHNRVVTG